MRLEAKIIIAVGIALLLILGIYFFVLAKDETGVNVGNHPPNAVIDFPDTIYLNEPAAFSARGSGDDDGDELSYLWEFHDGTNTTGIAINHTYTRYYGNIHDDTHQVNLTVFDGKDSDRVSVYITVMMRPDFQAPTVSLVSSSTDVPFVGLYYFLRVASISKGDSNIGNMSYKLVSARTNETLAGGENTTVYDAYAAPIDSPVRYLSGDEDMEMNDLFEIEANELNATEGDYFYLYHIPTGFEMCVCQLSG